MSQINVTTIKSRVGGAPTLSEGLVCSGIATFSDNVSIAGTITYNDVTNVDSVGVITARGGLKVGPLAGIAATIYLDGSTCIAGVATATQLYEANKRVATMGKSVAMAMIFG